MKQCISVVLANEFLKLSCQIANKLVYTPLVIGNYKKSQLCEEIKHLRWDWRYKPVMPATAVKKLISMSSGLAWPTKRITGKKALHVRSSLETKIQKASKQHIHWSSMLSYFFIYVSKINSHLVSYTVQYSFDIIYLRSFIIDCFTAQYFMP